MSIDIQIGNITHKGDVKSAVIISRPNPLVLMSVLDEREDGIEGGDGSTFSTLNDNDDSLMMHLVQLVRYVSIVRKIPPDEVMTELAENVNTTDLQEIKKGK